MIIERFRSAILILSSTLLLAACQSPKRVDAGRAAVNQNAAAAKPAPTPEANILVDEPRLAKPYAVIGGSVQNVGPRKLEQLSVLIELRRRDDGALERREASVAPADLSPGEQGKFALKVEPEEFRGSSVVGLRSSGDGAAAGRDVAFKAMPGAKRPPERFPDRVVDVKVPGKKSKGDDSGFINTPDTPIKVP
jgi:hypothetical protein